MPNKFISSDPFGIAVYHTSVKVAGLRVRDMVEGGAMAWGRVPSGDCSWLPAAKGSISWFETHNNEISALRMGK